MNFIFFSFRYGDHKCQKIPGAVKSDPPYKLKIFKGFKNVMIRKDFANFLIYHPVAKAFQEYMNDTWTPDEHFYATMSRIKHIGEKLQVDCGNQEARSCDACPEGQGSNWCSGDCVLKEQKCILRSESKWQIKIIGKSKYICVSFCT